MLVHLNQSALLMHYAIFEIEIPAELIDEYPMAQLPENWAEYPSPIETAEIGDAWLSAADSQLALAVPSAVNQLPFEKNYILNPNHPMFEAVIAKAVMHEMKFDGRLKD
jgi:RES domain-containing protein